MSIDNDEEFQQNTDFAFISSDVAFNSRKLPHFSEIISNLIFSSLPPSAHVDSFNFVPMVEDVIINDKDEEGRELVVNLIHPEEIKFFTKNMVALKIYGKATSTTSTTTQQKNDLERWFKDSLLPKIIENKLMKDEIFQTFRFKTDSEIIRKFIHHFVFGKIDKSSFSENLSDYSPFEIISLSNGDVDDEDNGNPHSFFAEYFSKSAKSKIRIPILLTERERIECLRGIEFTVQNFLVYSEETNIPLYVEFELGKRIFFKHPYSSIPYWFEFGSSSSEKTAIKKFIAENVEEVNFSRVLKNFDSNEDFIFTRSFTVGGGGSLFNPNRRCHHHPQSPSCSSSSFRNSIEHLNYVEDPKQILKALAAEILSAFEMELYYGSVYVNSKSLIESGKKDGVEEKEVIFKLKGGIEKAIEYVWKGLIPVVEIHLLPCFYSSLVSKTTHDIDDDDDFFSERLYTASVVSVLKTFAEVEEEANVVKSQQFKFILEMVRIIKREDEKKDDDCVFVIEVPLWSFGSVKTFVKNLRGEIQKMDFDYKVSSSSLLFETRDEGSSSPLKEKSSSRVYFREKQIFIRFNNKEDEKEEEEFVFTKRCINESDPVTFENFEKDLTRKEQYEILFNEKGKHGYKFETIESVIKNEYPTPLFPLTREPIVESICIFNLKVSGILPMIDKNNSLLEFIFPPSPSSTKKPTKQKLFNFKVSIDSRVDEDDYIYPLVSDSPTSYCYLASSVGQCDDRSFPSLDLSFPLDVVPSDDKKNNGDDVASSPSADGEDDGEVDESETIVSSTTRNSSFLVTVSGSYFKNESPEFIFSFTLPSTPYLKTIDDVVKARDALVLKNEEGIFYSTWKRLHPLSSIPVVCSIFPFFSSKTIKRSSSHHSKNERERIFLFGWLISHP